MISVIMPVYNGQKFLRESIESILNQTYKNFEFIIIDDGSTDDTLEIIKEYANKDSRIKYITRKNRGLVKSLNEGISISKGIYLARMDADDLCPPDRFKKQFEFMEKNKDVSLLGCMHNFFYERNNFFVNEKCFEDFKDVEELIIGKGFAICHPAFFIRKNKLLHSYDENLLYAEDLQFQLEFLLKGEKIDALKDILINVRKHESSKTMQDGKNTIIEIITLRLKYISEKYNVKNKKILVWGTGEGAKTLINNEKFKELNYEIVSFIDTFRSGKYEGINIIKPQDILKCKFDYILIATSPGRIYAQDYLETLGIKPIKGYFTMFI